jgi:methylase of polypeptide subunit release factors
LIRRLLDQIPIRLQPTGSLGLELDPGHAHHVADLTASTLPHHDVEIRKDLAGLDRFVLATPRI